MQSKLQELNDCLSCIEWKIAHYKEFEMMAPVEAEEELVSDQSVVA
jgi:hypothetical protein